MVSPDVLDLTSGRPLAPEPQILEVQVTSRAPQHLQLLDDVLLGEEASSSPCLRSLITSAYPAAVWLLVWAGTCCVHPGVIAYITFCSVSHGDILLCKIKRLLIPNNTE